MALVLSNNNLRVRGTDIDLNSVYVRLEFSCRKNGKMIEVYSYYFLNKQKYLENDYLNVDIGVYNFTINVNDINLNVLELVHNYCKDVYEDMGYNVIITDL